MRSSSGGWVENKLLNRAWVWLPDVSSGSSIQRCAVAFDAVCTTDVSSCSFFNAEINPGG